MAQSTRTTASRVAAGAAAWSARLAAAALAAAALAGCGGDPDGSIAPGGAVVATAPAGEPTAVGGQSMVLAIEKPLGGATVAGSAAAGAAGAGPSPTPAGVPSVSGKVRYGLVPGGPTGVGAPLAGALPLPAADAWNRPIAALSPDPASAMLIAAIGAADPVKLGFGEFAGVPYAIVDGLQARQVVRSADGAVRQWPIPGELTASADASGRLAVVDREAGVLYELHGATRAVDGVWQAAALAAWRLDVADSAPVDTAGAVVGDGGMPVFPGLLRHDEAAAGTIRHALRITVPALHAEWVAPARRTAGTAPDATLPRIGARLRLKAGTVIPADASVESKAILTALKTYGAIVAGVGPALSIEGAPSTRWDAVRLASELARVRGDDFEVLAHDGSTPR